MLRAKILALLLGLGSVGIGQASAHATPAPTAATHASGAGASKAGKGPSLGPMQIELTTDSVRRMLEALPEITKKTSAQQSAFLGSLTGSGPPGGAPQMSPEEVAELRAIFERYGFSMEEFAMKISALLATYLILSPEAFERQLPREDKPEIRAILTDPNIPESQKEALRKQIAFARQNKDKIREQLSALASPANQAVVKPMLPEVAKVFTQAETMARKAMQSSNAGPRRAKAKD